MKKFDLINKLKEIEGNPEVFIDFADGKYPVIEVALLTTEETFEKEEILDSEEKELIVIS